jgi:serine/threonine protein phosphatase PrpC
VAAIDGVGGYMGGDIAAKIAKEYIEQYMAEPKGDIESMLREAVVHANNQIFEASKQDLKLSQMCCVLTAAVADANTQKLYFVHVGDTRLYCLRNGELNKLSKDHSIVGIREDANELTEEEAMNHPRRNEILREVGSVMHQIDDTDFYDSVETDFLPNDLLLLCSDGLSDMLTQAQMAAVLRKNTSLQKKVEELIDLANRQGGKDNITVVLAQNNAPEPAVKPSHFSKKTQEVRTEQIQNVPVQETVIAQNTEESKKVKESPLSENNRMKWLGGTLLLLFVGVIGFLLGKWRPESPETQPPATEKAKSIPAVNQKVNMDTLVMQALKSKSRRLELTLEMTGDTLRLADVVLLKDTLTIVRIGSPLLILPADSTTQVVAFQVLKGSFIKIENVIFSGFKTAIQTEENVKLSLKNVQFKGEGVKIRAEWIPKDTLKTREIIFSTTSLPN